MEEISGELKPFLIESREKEQKKSKYLKLNCLWTFKFDLVPLFFVDMNFSISVCFYPLLDNGEIF